MDDLQDLFLCGSTSAKASLAAGNCQSVEFQAMQTTETPAALRRGRRLQAFMDKVKKHAATVKARHDEHKQTVADEKQRQQEVEAERHRHAPRTARRRSNQARRAVRFPDSRKRRGLLEVWTSSTTSSLCRLPMSGVGALRS